MGRGVKIVGTLFEFGLTCLFIRVILRIHQSFLNRIREIERYGSSVGQNPSKLLSSCLQALELLDCASSEMLYESVCDIEEHIIFFALALRASFSSTGHHCSRFCSTRVIHSRATRIHTREIPYPLSRVGLCGLGVWVL